MTRVKIAILYASFDGQTERVAQRVGAVLAADGHAVTVLRAEAPQAAAAPAAHDALVIGGAIRYGRFARSLAQLVRAHASVIAARPNAFFCVSLSARPGGNPREVSRYLDEFRARTGWEPRATASFAGALRYRAYNPLLRLAMKLISRMAGGDTDTSRDYEYTDWEAVERFAAQFAASLQTRAAA